MESHAPNLPDWLVRDKASVINDYLMRVENPPDLTDADSQLPADIAGQLFRPGQPLHKTVVIIPVAAAAERDTIGHALDEYARQQPLEPFSIVLGLNLDDTIASLSSEAITHFADTIANLDAAQARHPQLDIRSSIVEYTKPRIGEIRRDLWNASLLTARADGAANYGNMIGINHDIDLVHLPRQHIGVIQQFYRDRAHAEMPVYTQVRHAWDLSHPQTSKAVLWHDFVNSAAEMGYTGGVAIPMSFYAAKGGFEAVRRTHEIDHMIETFTPPTLLRAGRLVSSPRRFVERLPTHGFRNIWTNDSFGSNDPCRTPEYVAEQADLSLDGLVQVIKHGGEYDIANIFERLTPIISSEITAADVLHGITTRNAATAVVNEHVRRRFGQKLRVARRVMAGCLPTGSSLSPKYLQLENYSYQVQVAANQIVSARL